MSSAESYEERVINEEYKIWKKNSLQLYDLIVTHALEWPSLCVQWMPQTVLMDNEAIFEHRLLLGTHTAQNEPNSLIMSTIRLPTSDPSKISHLYNDERMEWGGYESSPVLGGLKIDLKIPHDREVNRVQYMPQNPCVIATFSASGDILIFDYTKHGSSVSQHKVCSPQLRLKSHQKEGYGLAWSPFNEGQLLSASDDHTVRLWDIAQGVSLNNTISSSQQCFTTHTNVVGAIDWHKKHPFIFGSADDDKKMMIWDTRRSMDMGGNAAQKPAFSVVAHTAEVNSLSFSPFNEHILATGSSDQTVALWDLRNLKSRLHTLKGHSNGVFQVKWSPHFESVLASSALDRRIHVWDLKKINHHPRGGSSSHNHSTQALAHASTQGSQVNQQPAVLPAGLIVNQNQNMGTNNEDGQQQQATPEDHAAADVSPVSVRVSPRRKSNDGYPPELIFIHGGHLSRISDFDWCPTDPFVIASVSEDNLLQVWQMREEFYK